MGFHYHVCGHPHDLTVIRDPGGGLPGVERAKEAIGESTDVFVFLFFSLFLSFIFLTVYGSVNDRRGKRRADNICIYR